MQQRIMLRALACTRTLRRYLDDHGFLDIETPMLTKGHAGGCRDYLVPAASTPEVFRLPQSPQLFKQLLMMSGWTATTRSCAVSATRTCAPTASPSSPSSTSRCRS